jgi:hypothetical protein
MNLTGFRTFIVTAMSAFIVPYLAKHGLTLSPDQQVWAVGEIMGLVGIGMRLITRTPPGKPNTTLPPPSPSTHRQGGFASPFFLARLLITAIFLLILGILLACASAPAPKTLDQSLAYVEGAVITAQQGITTALTAGQLSSAQATNANTLALNVLSIVTTARAAESSSPASAQNDLALAQTALTAVQTYLTTAKGK